MSEDQRVERASVERATVEPVLAEFRQIEEDMASPEVLAEPGRLRGLGRRYAELGRVVGAWTGWRSAQEDLEAARELLAETREAGAAAQDRAELEAELEAEVATLAAAEADAHELLRRALVPSDPDDGRDAILEIKAGEGGAESALFAGDLLRMYQRYAERRGWVTQVLSATDSDLGGVKDVALAIKSRAALEDPAQGVFARLKYEGGVHRVQRVPVTESQGRIHTSAAGVLVLPEVDDPGELEIEANDLRIDVFRSSGPGGQSVNTTDSAVRITHLPTGIVVSMQNEKSQLQNREAGMRVLRARLLAARQEEAAAVASEARRSQVRTVDRSERIRTYNFPENRIVDHRTGYKAYNLDAVLDGDLDAVVDSAVETDEAHRMAAHASPAAGGGPRGARGPDGRAGTR